MKNNLLDRFIIDKKRFTGPVMVTGASGCIGSWIISMLHRAGVASVALDIKKNTSRLKLLMTDQEMASINWELGDLTDTDYILQAVENHQPQVIIHLAALQIPFCAADPILGAKVNVTGFVNIMEAARKQGIEKVIYASSIAAYGAIDDVKFQPNLYGAYKLCNENISQVYFRDWNISSIGLRPGNVYGIARDQGLTAQTTQAMLAAAAGKPFTIKFSGSISAIYTGEVAAAFIKAACSTKAGARVFDINGTDTTVEEWMELVRKINPDARIDIQGPVLPFPTQTDEMALRRYIGDFGSMPLEEGVQVTYSAFSQLIMDGMLKD